MPGAGPWRRMLARASGGAAALMVAATARAGLSDLPEPPPAPGAERRQSAPQPKVQAAPSPPRPASKPHAKRPRVVSLTISPLHFFYQQPFQFALEVRPVAHLGIAAVGAYGWVRAHTSQNDNEDYTGYKVGGNVVGYFVPGHPFDSMNVGAQMLLARMGKLEYDPEIDPDNDGLLIGGFVGYKAIASFGLTFEAQLGLEAVTARKHAYSVAPGGDRVTQGFGPVVIFNLDVGWSF